MNIYINDYLTVQNNEKSVLHTKIFSNPLSPPCISHSNPEVLFSVSYLTTVGFQLLTMNFQRIKCNSIDASLYPSLHLIL